MRSARFGLLSSPAGETRACPASSARAPSAAKLLRTRVYNNNNIISIHGSIRERLAPTRLDLSPTLTLHIAPGRAKTYTAHRWNTSPCPLARVPGWLQPASYGPANTSCCLPAAPQTARGKGSRVVDRRCA